MTKPTDSLGYPPRGMSRIEAARYIGVGVTKFDEMVNDGRMPKPRKIDNRSVWDSYEVNAFFADLPKADTRNQIDELLNGIGGHG